MGQISCRPWQGRSEEDKYGPCQSDILVVIISLLNCIFSTRGIRSLSSSTETVVSIWILPAFLV